MNNNPLKLTKKEFEAVKFWSDKLHTKPSPETLEFMAKIDEQIGTLASLLSGVRELLEMHIEDNKQQREDNKKEHEGIMKRQDHTNGSVMELEKKNEYNRGRLNMFAVIISAIILPMFVYILKDYIERRDTILKQEQEYLELRKQFDNIDNRIQAAIEKNNNNYFENIN